eukprot:g3319.t1
MEKPDGIERKVKKFKNGDRYEGGWKNGLPEGHGKYTWKDGSTYSGHWKEGTKHGIGEYQWPSRAKYSGDWQNGCMHGYGIFVAADGSVYQGNWAQDLKHGLGKKTYSNKDKYEGIWSNGKPHGPGRYVWQDGNEYNGEWQDGQMHGQGTFQWKSGERYDGEWKTGREFGLGTFQWKDNATYDGLWQSGKKHGIGIFRPAPLENRKPGSGASVTDEMTSIEATSLAGGNFNSSDGESDGPLTAPALSQKTADALLTEDVAAGNNSESVFLREYVNGSLNYEQQLNTDNANDIELLSALFRRDEPGKIKRLLNRDREKGPGEVIYKGHSSYDLMMNLQLGIQYSVGRINTQRSSSTDSLSDEYFIQKTKILFPRRGSQHTPPHMSNDFKWKDYAPMVFKELRKAFGVDPADYLISLCGNHALRELPSPGKSGSIFYLSHDDRFIIKTMKASEMKHLFAKLSIYYEHMRKNPQTLVTKFYGLHRVTPYKGPKIRFMVMGNLFLTDLPIHNKFDLKGSTQGRFTKPEEQEPGTTLKDLDLDVTFKLEEGWHEKLHDQLQSDCILLEGMNVMDYSLLLGVHYRKQGLKAIPELSPESDQEERRHREKCESQIRSLKLDDQRSEALLKLVNLKLESRRTMRHGPQQALVRQPARNPTMRPVAYADGGTEALAHYLGYDRVQLGKNMAATAIKTEPSGDTEDAEDVVLYMGIIDILQDYNMSKKFEHGWKSFYMDGKAISAVDPIRYSERFRDFMDDVFT